MWYVSTVIVEQKVIFVKFSNFFYVFRWYVGKVFGNVCIICVLLHRFYFLYYFCTIYFLQQINGVFMKCFKFSYECVVNITWKRQKMLRSPMCIYPFIGIRNKLYKLWECDIVAFWKRFHRWILSVLGYDFFTIYIPIIRFSWIYLVGEARYQPAKWIWKFVKCITKALFTLDERKIKEALTKNDDFAERDDSNHFLRSQSSKC